MQIMYLKLISLQKLLLKYQINLKQGQQMDKQWCQCRFILSKKDKSAKYQTRLIKETHKLYNIYKNLQFYNLQIVWIKYIDEDDKTEEGAKGLDDWYGNNFQGFNGQCQPDEDDEEQNNYNKINKKNKHKKHKKNNNYNKKYKRKHKINQFCLIKKIIIVFIQSMNQLILISLLAITLVQADLPVHCLKHQIVGKWNMEVSDVQLKGVGSVPCGHHVPDTQHSSYKAGWEDFHPSNSFELNLGNDYTVTDKDKKQSGSWTMVYDEGFEVEHNGIKYFAFSKYEPNGVDYKSLCGETLIGWYNNQKTGEKGCYRAKKSDGNVDATDSYKLISVVQPEFIQKSTRHGDRVKLTKEFRNHKEAVDKLNSIPKLWKAKAYDNLEGKSLLELNKMAGRRKHYQGKSIKRAASFSQLKSSDVSDLPKTFSLERYLDPPRQQKQCGSCYAISTMEMLSARLKMKGEKVTLSPQYSVDCNYYNQGCDGGYPFLVEKFASEQYLVTEEQYPYKGDVGTCKKIDYSQSQKVYGAKNYRYIGGGYGLSNERDIMLELFNNGPIIMNFEPAQDFMYYSSGIYHSVAQHDWSSSDHPEWEKVDHSVLCYGWGEENGVKFWLLQNSWGQQWGENGNFRMKRGVDESAIESMAEAAEPIIYSKSSGEFIELKQSNLRKQ